MSRLGRPDLKAGFLQAIDLAIFFLLVKPGSCPSVITNAELPHAFLVPNRHLKAMCQQFLDEVREVEEAGG